MLIILSYCLIGVYDFDDNGSAALTPMFYRNTNDKYYFFPSFYFSPKEMCEKAIDYDRNYDCICNVLTNAKLFWMNMALFFLLLAGLVGNAFGVYAEYWILRGKYFRYTNLLLLL